MKPSAVLFEAFFFLLMVWIVPVVAAASPADLIIFNGTIHTMDGAQPAAEMVVVVGDRIAHVGSADGMAAWRGEKTRAIDLKGKTLVPGLIESHGHLIAMGHARMRLDVSDVRSYRELVDRVAAAVKTARPGEWILGGGWHQSKWEPPPDPSVNGFPVHDALSRVSPDHPVFLTHASGHAGLANAKAMEVAGIDKGSVFDGGGEILRTPEGRPTGIFTESAQSLIRSQIPPSTPERDRQALELAIRECLENGITSFRDAASGRAAIARYREFLAQGRLDVRVWAMLDARDRDLVDEWLAKGPEVGQGGEYLTVRAFKLFADGALGSRGAWLLDPYSDRPDHSGHALIPMADVYDLSVRALKSGFQVCVHAIGDRANREVLDRFERAFQAMPAAAADHRFRIEHAQHISAADIPRFGRLGVIASMHGIHMASDRPWAIDRLGRDRIETGAYAWQKLLAAGAVVVNGTDAPVEPVSPIASFYASVTRKTLAGKPQGGYEPDLRMTRYQALRSYTIDAAFAGFEEDIKGSIAPGKLADFTVLSQDILTVPEARLLDTRVEMTVVGGVLAYQRSGE